MLQIIKQLFSVVDVKIVKELLEKGAMLIDVRSYPEFVQGHVTGAINIPLHRLMEELPRLRREKEIIVCCASGMRSGHARLFLQRNGIVNVVNGGAWQSIQNAMKKVKQ